MIETVGIVGAGPAGNGIAHVFAQAGCDLLLNDISAAGLQAALATIDRNPHRQVARDKVTVQAKAVASAEDFTAFIVNRALMPMINEAVYTLHEGVGSATPIDCALKLMRALADFIGLGTCLAIMNGLADSTYPPAHRWRNMPRRVGLAAKPNEAFTGIAGKPPSPRGKGGLR